MLDCCTFQDVYRPRRVPVKYFRVMRPPAAKGATHVGSTSGLSAAFAIKSLHAARRRPYSRSQRSDDLKAAIKYEIGPGHVRGLIGCQEEHRV